MRERLARLETAERPAARGDFVVIDYVGRLARRAGPRRAGRGRSPGGEGRDQLVELGSGNLIPGFEEALARGRRRGDPRGAADVPAPTTATSSSRAARRPSR